ncbi:hypothetical protein Tco_0205358 [Tanacetum coccineum]
MEGAQGDREAEVFQVSNDDTVVAQRWLEDKQPERKTNTDCLLKEQEKEFRTGWKIKTGDWLQQQKELVKETNVTLLAKVFHRRHDTRLPSPVSPGIGARSFFPEKCKDNNNNLVAGKVCILTSRMEHIQHNIPSQKTDSDNQDDATTKHEPEQDNDGGDDEDGEDDFLDDESDGELFFNNDEFRNEGGWIKDDVIDAHENNISYSNSHRRRNLDSTARFKSPSPKKKYGQMDSISFVGVGYPGPNISSSLTYKPN